MIRKIQEFLSRKASFSGLQQKTKWPHYTRMLFFNQNFPLVIVLSFFGFQTSFPLFYIVASVVYDLLFFLSVSYLICEGLYLYKFDRKPSNSVHNFVKSIMSEYAKIHRDKFMYKVREKESNQG